MQYLYNNAYVYMESLYHTQYSWSKKNTRDKYYLYAGESSGSNTRLNAYFVDLDNFLASLPQCLQLSTDCMQ